MTDLTLTIIIFSFLTFVSFTSCYILCKSIEDAQDKDCKFDHPENYK